MKTCKDRWDALLVQWQRLNVGTVMPKSEFAKLIGQIWLEIEPQVKRNGFRKAGIYGVNREELKENQFDSLKLRHQGEHKNRQNSSINKIKINILIKQRHAGKKDKDSKKNLAKLGQENKPPVGCKDKDQKLTNKRVDNKAMNAIIKKHSNAKRSAKIFDLEYDYFKPSSKYKRRSDFTTSVSGSINSYIVSDIVDIDPDITTTVDADEINNRKKNYAA